LSLMNGYESGMRERYLGMFSHVTLSDADWNLPRWQQRRKQILETKDVVAVAPFIEKQVMLKQGNKVQATFLQAIQPKLEKDISTINQHTTPANSLDKLNAGGYNIILGETLAKNLNISIGDSITLLSINKQSFSTASNVNTRDMHIDTSPILKDFTVVATFKVDKQIFDSAYAFIHLDDALETFSLKGDVTGLHVQVADPFDVKEASYAIAEVQDKYKEEYVITNWKTSNANLFKVIQLQKSMLFLVVLLIIAVAAFNLVSTLIMMVTEKQSDIAILRTMGMSPAHVMRIFVVQGSLLGLVGTAIGVVIGLLVASNITDVVHSLEQLFNFNLLKAEVHEITEIDAEINPYDVLLIAICAITLSVLATLFPAWKAAKVPPAEALRYE